MSVIDEIIKTLVPAKILSIQVGMSRTAVLAETPEGLRCGLAASLSNAEYDHRCNPRVAKAGHLIDLTLAELTGLIHSPSQTEASIALATVNALLPKWEAPCTTLNATELMISQGKGKNIAVIGHFPFIDEMRPQVKNLWVLELNPREGDLPAEAAAQIIPQADLLAITATTLINQTFEALVALCRENTTVIMLGPTTPLTPILFENGVDILSGTEVLDPEAVMRGIAEGASMHQLKKEGFIRYVSISK
jgi:uncharacterized protein (DUF4213/DUF364 family)